jgi:hypothetical protein
MATLTVKFADVNGKPRTQIVDVPDLKVTRPIDVIQVIYNKDPDYKPKQSGGGTTIWKMGKPIGGVNCIDADTLYNNDIKASATVELVTIDVDPVAL